MKKIDLIALDLDGNRAQSGRTGLRRPPMPCAVLRESGIHVVVSTGRICGEARDFALMLGTDDQMVTSGGDAVERVGGALHHAYVHAVGSCRACVCRGGAHRHDHGGMWETLLRLLRTMISNLASISRMKAI